MNDKMKKCINNSGVAITLLVAGVILGIFLLAIVYIMPTWWIDYHIGESISAMKDEGMYPKLKTGEMLDNFTDAIMLNMIFYKDGTFADNMLLNQYVSGTNPSPVEILFEYMAYGLDSTQYITSYARYWHGYQAILTPLLVLFNVNEIRAINTLAQLMVVIGVVAFLSKRKRADMIIPFAMMYFSLAPVSLFNSFQFSSTFYVMSLLSLVVASKYEKWSFAKLCFAFEVAGIAEAYFDFLTYPAASLGVPMIMYFALDAAARKTFVQRAKELVMMGAAWVFGYGGMWSGKWVVATLFTDENVISNAIASVKYRSSTSIDDRALSYSETLYRNVLFLSEANGGVFWIFIAVALIACLLLLVSKRKMARQANLAVALMIGICCVIPFVWYLVTMNHSTMHAWFTFRELSITVYGAMTLLYLTLYRKPKAIPEAA